MGYVQCKGILARDELQSQAFLGILRAVKSGYVEGQASSEVKKINREDLPDNICQVHEEFAAVFLKDLSRGVPPRRIGNEFEVDLEPDTAPIHRTIYKLNALERQEARTQIESILEHVFIRPSKSLWGCPSIVCTKERQQPSVLY